jgi:MoaA/NifB/PqqE/SkfB family radical SAM enzyme
MGIKTSFEDRKKIQDINNKILYGLNFCKSLKRHEALIPPKWVHVEITNLCNLRCTMCDRWKWIKEDKKAADSLSSKTLENLFTELSQIGVKLIILSGGEPLIRKDFISIIEYINNLKMAVTIISNGTLMDLEKAECLAKNNTTVIFSIDGLSDTHDAIRGVQGAYERAIQGIETLAKARKGGLYKNRIAINYTVQKDNIKNMVACFKLAKEIDVDVVEYNIVHGKPDAALEGQDFLEIQEVFRRLNKLERSSRTHLNIGRMLKFAISGRVQGDDLKTGLHARELFKTNPVPCLTAYHGSFIDSFGRVFPCCFCYFDNSSYSGYEKERELYCLGNIQNSKFCEIWYGQKYNEFRQHTDPVDIEKLSSACGQCYDYFTFRKYYRRFKLIEKTGLL